VKTVRVFGIREAKITKLGENAKHEAGTLARGRGRSLGRVRGKEKGNEKRNYTHEGKGSAEWSKRRQRKSSDQWKRRRRSFAVRLQRQPDEGTPN